MTTALFSHRYYELIRTAADTRFESSHSDQQTELEDLSHVRHRGFASGPIGRFLPNPAGDRALPLAVRRSANVLREGSATYRRKACSLKSAALATTSRTTARGL